MSGILSKIGFLQDGELSVDAIKSVIEEMIKASKLGPPSIKGIPLGVGIPEGDLEYMSLTGTLEEHEEKFPQFHGVYINFLKTAMSLLDIQPVAVLKNVPPAFIHDPTQPIVDFLNALKQNFSDLIPASIDLDLLLLSKIPDIGSLIGDFVSFLQELIDAEDILDVELDSLNDMMDTIFSDFPEELGNIKSKISEEKEFVLNSMKEKALALFGGFADQMPEIGIPNPIISLDMLGIELPDHQDALSELPIQLFAEGPPPGALRFLLNFITEMIEKITQKIISITTGADPQLILDLIAKITEGVDGLIQFLIDQLLGPVVQSLRDAWPSIEKYLVPACFFAAMLVLILKVLIVAFVGILLGPGLITFGIAKGLELI